MDPNAPGGESAVAYEPILGDASSCAVKLPVFEGPLDLLLHLIRVNEVDVTDIPIARIAEQYLEYLELMRELDLDVAAEYLLMAATLAWIKSRMLLPPDGTLDEEEGPDPRADLVARLLEYQRFKQASRDLGERALLGRDVFEVRVARPEPPSDAEAEIEVGLFQLLEALRGVLRRAREAGVVHEVVTEAITVRERMLAVMERMEQAEAIEFLELVCGSDGKLPTLGFIVATFLAVLELVRLSALRVYQGIGPDGVPEGPIRLRRAGLQGAPDWSERISELM